MHRSKDQALFDHLIGGGEQRWRYGQPECLGRLKIDHQLVLGWDLHWQVGRLLAFEDWLRITVHQFRHAAGALILQSRPGEYELVRRLLGHRNVQATINAYIGLENIQASEIFSEIVREHMGHGLEAAE
jgi:integrase